MGPRTFFNPPQALINLAGPAAIQRGYVYFSEVPDIFSFLFLFF